MEAKFENGLISPSQQEQHQQESQEEVKKSDEISKLKDENRSLRIKIAGVETLSSLLNGTRDELDTVLAEKESMEIEVATLQCRCSMLEKEIAEKRIDVKDSQSRASKEMFETVLRENKQLKNELKQAKISKHANEVNIVGGYVCLFSLATLVGWKTCSFLLIHQYSNLKLYTLLQAVRDENECTGVQAKNF